MTIQTISDKTTIILNDGTLIKFDEKHGLIWFHLNSQEYSTGSYRLNTRLKIVDVEVIPQDQLIKKGKGQKKKCNSQ